MANTLKYLNHLLQNTGITPACSEEERAAADIIAKTFANHGFEPEIQEFSASGSAKLVQAVLGIAAFLGAVLMGIGGIVGIIGLLVALAAAVIFAMERNGRPVLSQLGNGGLSQNVIAYHKASGPLASPRNRPVVVVAHYDSPRADLLCQEPYASYRPLLVKLLPYAMMAPAVIAVVRLLPVPGAAKIILWILAILAALVPLANSVAIIANRFVLPYTTGSVCNKSSVAAMLGVMDAVSPYQGHGEEFPDDISFDEFFSEQRRIAEEAAAAAAAEAEAASTYPHEAEEGAEVSEGEDDAAPDDEAVDAGTVESDASDNLVEHDDEIAGGDASEEFAADEASDPNADAAPAADETATFAASDMPADPNSTVAMNMDDVMGAAAQAVEAAQTTASMPVTVHVDDDAPAAEIVDETTEAEPSVVNTKGNYRFGADAIRGLGMLPDSCALVYESDDEDDDREELTAFDVQPVDDDDWEPAPVAAFSDDNDSFAGDDGVEDGADGAYDEEPIEVDAEDVEETPYDEDEFVEDDEPAAAETETDDDVIDDGSVFVAQPVLDFSAEDTSGDEKSDADEGAQDESHDEEESNPETSADEVEVVAEAESESLEEVVSSDLESTQLFEPVADVSDDPSHTIAMPAHPTDTVDALMAQISVPSPAPARAPQVRSINVPSTADAPVPRTPETANRASLFDLPDPSSAPVDPFASPAQSAAPAASSPTEADVAAARSSFTVVSSTGAASTSVAQSAPESSTVVSRVETISAPAPEQEKPRRGLARLFGRKKKKNDSMSSWLGVDENFDAKSSGSDIGSWDNFEDDDPSWKGGATGVDGVSEDELREAITSMGDDELLGHDIWFVATGASENGNAGIKAFLREHRAKLRGVFLINLECVGAGQVAMVATEGEQRVLKGDKRIMKLVSRVSADFHNEYGAVDMPYVTTDAYAAMSMSLRSLTIGGVEGSGFALGHTEEDQSYNIDVNNIAMASDVVTEVIRRS